MKTINILLTGLCLFFLQTPSYAEESSEHTPLLSKTDLAHINESAKFCSEEFSEKEVLNEEELRDAAACQQIVRLQKLLLEKVNDIIALKVEMLNQRYLMERHLDENRREQRLRQERRNMEAVRHDEIVRAELLKLLLEFRHR